MTSLVVAVLAVAYGVMFLAVAAVVVMVAVDVWVGREPASVESLPVNEVASVRSHRARGWWSR